MNLFESIPPSEDASEIRCQRISTRVFILLLVICSICLIFYNSVILVVKYENKKNPSIEEYFELEQKYPDTLSCPCEKTSLENHDLIKLDYKLHQMCSSEFVNWKWREYLASFYPGFQNKIEDFRGHGLFLFQALSSLCNLTNEVNRNSINRFYGMTFSSIIFLSSAQLELHFNTSVNGFLSSARREFLLGIKTTENMIYSNMLQSTLSTNAYMVFIFRGVIDVRSTQYGNCSCKTNHRCTTVSQLYNEDNDQSLMIIPGLRIGCYMMEALLQSSLECFYNQTCLDQLTTLMNESVNINMTTMNGNIASRFTPENTVNDILQNLFVEKWYWSSSHSSYFRRCRPISCSFSYKAHNDIIHIITNVLGIIGGLTAILKIFTPLIICQIILRHEHSRAERKSCLLSFSYR